MAKKGGRKKSKKNNNMPKPAKVVRPMISENAGVFLLATGIVAYTMDYKTLGMLAMGAGVFGLLNGNLYV